MDSLFWDALRDVVANPKTSDVILCPGEPISFLSDDEKLSGQVATPPAAFAQILAEANIDANALDGDGHWSFQASRFRCNMITALGKKQLCMRPIPLNPPTFDDCDFPRLLRPLILDHGTGLFIVTGPTGTGKTTSLAAAIMEIALSNRQHILTLEDPPEYIFPRDLPSLVTQRSLREDTRNVVAAMQSIMRQKPRTILMGEIRDPETALLTLTLATSGHKVFTTMHSASAAGGITSFLNWLPEGSWQRGCYMLSEYLQAVMAQRLLPGADRRYAIHEILCRTDAVAAIINSAGSRPDRLKDLQAEIDNSGRGADGPHQSWERSMRNWRDQGIELHLAA